jgi:catechol 2,3-dioxygenase
LFWIKARAAPGSQSFDMPRSEPIHDIAHLGSVELLTPRPEESLWYFRDVLGMEIVNKTRAAAYLRAYGDYATCTLKLTAASRAGVGCIAWRTVSPEALDRRAAAVTAAGLGIGWTNGDFGRGRSFRCHDPDGHVMELYYEEQRYIAPAHQRSTLKNLPQKYPSRGVGVRRTDHLALLAKDVAANRRFAQEQLGFQLREQVRFDEGRTEIGSWMSPTAVHHQLAYVVDVKGGAGRLHHVSLWVDNREDVLRAADILVEHGIFVEAGPSKHNNSQGFYLYSYEPGGNRVEIYSGSYLVMAPDWEPVIWNEEERGTGVYWGATLPQSFLTYATPDIDAPQPEPGARVPSFPVFY